MRRASSCTRCRKSIQVPPEIPPSEPRWCWSCLDIDEATARDLACRDFRRIEDFVSADRGHPLHDVSKL